MDWIQALPLASCVVSFGLFRQRVLHLPCNGLAGKYSAHVGIGWHLDGRGPPLPKLKNIDKDRRRQKKYSELHNNHMFK